LISFTPFFTSGFTGVETGVIEEDTFVCETFAFVGKFSVEFVLILFSFLLLPPSPPVFPPAFAVLFVVTLRDTTFFFDLTDVAVSEDAGSVGFDVED
jgi:hypothetical protein